MMGKSAATRCLSDLARLPRVRDWIDREYAQFKPAFGEPAYRDPMTRHIGRDGDAAIAAGQPAGSSSIGYRERLCNRRQWRQRS
jgi:hypothetical protein